MRGRRRERGKRGSIFKLFKGGDFLFKNLDSLVLSQNYWQCGLRIRSKLWFFRTALFKTLRPPNHSTGRWTVFSISNLSESKHFVEFDLDITIRLRSMMRLEGSQSGYTGYFGYSPGSFRYIRLGIFGLATTRRQSAPRNPRAFDRNQSVPEILKCFIKTENHTSAAVWKHWIDEKNQTKSIFLWGSWWTITDGTSKFMESKFQWSTLCANTEEIASLLDHH